MRLTNKKFIVYIVSSVLFFGAGWIGNVVLTPKPNDQNIETRCFYGSLEKPDFIEPSILIEINKTQSGYTFNGTLFSVSDVDFGAGTSIYIQLSASPEIKYKLDENKPALEIKFDNSIPARVDFSFSSVDMNFSSKEIDEISKFIDKKTDMLVLSIQIYDHAKTLIHIVNKVFVNE